MGFGSSLRKRVKKTAGRLSPKKLLRKQRKALKRAARAAGRGVVASSKLSYKTLTAIPHAISKKALGGRLDPWTREGRLEGAIAAGTTVAAFATGGVAAAGLAAAKSLAPGIGGGGSIGVPPELASGAYFDPVNLETDALAPRAAAPPAKESGGVNWIAAGAWVAGSFVAWKLLKGFFR